jgi:hypothetical protein
VVLVLAAVLLAAMAIYLAFVVDAGYILVVRTEAQNCADAAALAGAWAMVHDDRIRGYDPSVMYNARGEAIKFAALNSVGPNEHPVLRRNVFNIDVDGDILIGRLEDPADLNEQLSYGEPTRWNAMRVTVRCTRGRNQQSPLFFARMLGMTSFDTEATATAIFYDKIQGFHVTEDGPRCTLMPFAVEHDYWIDMIVNGGGDDDWTFVDAEQSISPGPDGIPELDMYPIRVWTKEDDGSGNFGTVDIGDNNNSVPDLRRQIVEGPNAEDLASYGGVFALSEETGALDLNGDTGVSAGIEDAIAQVVGLPKTILLYDRVTDQGNNTYFRIIGFAGIRIVDFDMHAGTKYIRVQPTYVADPTAVEGPMTGTNYYVGQPVRLVR